jgi:capsular polysaccharide biosynthesis protein
MNTIIRDDSESDDHGVRSSSEQAPGRLASPLSGLLGVMWQYKFIIAAATLASTAVAIWLTLSADDKYQASTLISPVSDESGGGRLGGLASIASEIGGGSLGISSPGNTQKQEYLAALTSEALTERYIKQNDLLPILFASKWDPAKRAWKDLPKDEIPTLWKANQFFKRHVRSVITDSKTTLTTLTIVWTNPNEAAKWANGLVKLTNDYLRAKAIAESERNIEYLKDQFAKTTIVGMQTAIVSNMEDQMKKAMIAQGNEEFALKVIDPAVAPEKRISPVPALWISTGFLVGLIGSTLLVYVRRFRPIRVYLNQYGPER